MDCKTARQLLSFARPKGYDLDADDRAALEQHLAVCPECDSAARADRQFDDHLGKAIRDVPVPAGLQERLLGRLRHQRDEWWKQRMGVGLRYAAAAAALLLLAFAGFSFWKERQPRLSSETAVSRVENGLMSPPTLDDAEHWFHRHGARGVQLPREFNSLYLHSFSLTDLEGKKVPYLLFIRPGSQGAGATVAEVYVLDGKRFRLDEQPPGVTDRSGDQFKVRVVRPEDRDFAYVIVYTGRLDDLLVPSRPAQ